MYHPHTFAYYFVITYSLHLLSSRVPRGRAKSSGYCVTLSPMEVTNLICPPTISPRWLLTWAPALVRATWSISQDIPTRTRLSRLCDCGSPIRPVPWRPWRLSPYNAYPVNRYLPIRLFFVKFSDFYIFHLWPIPCSSFHFSFAYPSSCILFWFPQYTRSLVWVVSLPPVSVLRLVDTISTDSSLSR